MEVKVCGLKFVDNLVAVSKLKPNYVGFVCFEGSKRYVDLEDWKELASSIDEISIPRVMVCVNPSLNFIESYLSVFKFDYIQLHGHEDENFCKDVKSNFDVRVIKAFSVDNNFEFENCAKYEQVSDLFIFDTKTKTYGGSGKVFDWSVLEAYSLSTNYLLSGGINPENMKLAIKHVDINKKAIGIDVNSGFEIEPGLKDIKKLEVLFNEKENYGL